MKINCATEFGKGNLHAQSCTRGLAAWRMAFFLCAMPAFIIAYLGKFFVRFLRVKLSSIA